jgi:hypothetical protein
MALEGVLGASFFISRQNEARRNPHNILRSIAYDLAVLNTSRAQSVWDHLTSAPNITSRHINEQARRFLAYPFPLQQIGGLSFLVVIDALDESDRNQEQEQEELISLLVSSLKYQAVKILVTSRDEPRISKMLDGLTDESFKLHRMDQSDVSKDIRAFYETRFQQLIRSRRLKEPNWPSPDDLDILTDRTGFLFIYAATVVNFISAERFSPVKRLHSILASHPESSQHDVDFEDLDKLYTQIVSSAIIVKGSINEHVQSRVKTLIGTIIVLQHPLRFQSIALFMMVFNDTWVEEELRGDLESLASVILMPENEADSVNIFHPSFPDYMQNPSRCKVLNLSVSSGDAHLSVALACLRIMNECLYRDICNIRDFTIENRKISDLPARLNHFVPEWLEYACVHWISHVVSAIVVRPLIEELEKFCKNHIFHWIEVLSLLQNLDAGYHGLPRTLDWSRVSSSPGFVIDVI